MLRPSTLAIVLLLAIGLPLLGSHHEVLASLIASAADATDSPTETSAPFVIADPYAVPGSYRKGELHVHSTNSFDGWKSLPPVQLARAYKERGYQFICITDHDVVSHPTEAEDASFIAIPGYESTSETGHITGAFLEQAVVPSLSPQARIDYITSRGGLAILNHPTYTIGWNGTDLRSLQGYSALELYNGITSTEVRAERVIQMWHDVLNARGGQQRIWAVAVDDAHEPSQIDRGWVMVKAAQLTDGAIHQALLSGAFYASNGPSYETLGVVSNAIVASSLDAATIRFIDQDRRVLKESPAAEASYAPTGTERWIRVEAVTADGHTAWSQPFWLLPNVVRAARQEGLLTGETLPRVRVNVFERDQYLGNTVADDAGYFAFALAPADANAHELALVPAASWPDQISGPRTTLPAS
jgi:hypothetical protein